MVDQSPKDTPEYWERRVAPYLGTKDAWIGVSATGMTRRASWAVHAFEKRGMRQVDRWLPTDGLTGDFGCGYGRWFALTAARRRVIGMDFAPALVRAAAAHAARTQVVVGDLRNPPFHENSLSSVYTAKSLQFLDVRERPIAIRRIFDCVVPGGHVILFERISGPEREKAHDWIRWGEEAGGNLLEWRGNQFAAFDRTTEALLAGVLRRRSARAPIHGDSIPGEVPALHAVLRATHARLREMLLLSSLTTESLAERVAPSSWAENGIFRFEKRE